MKGLSIQLFMIIAVSQLLVSCDFAARVEQKAAKINRYEKASLNLARANRELKAQISQLKYEVESLKSKNQFLKIQIEKANEATGPSRGLASVAPVAAIKNDKVKFSIYKWSPNQLITIAQKDFAQKNYERAAQYFHSLLTQYPGHAEINDEVYFQAGIAAYESNQHNDWAISYFGELIDKYPTSNYHRGAKLWRAMTHLKTGQKDKFFSTVEEFRKKYRNTSEWKILSSQYEKIVQHYKK